MWATLTRTRPGSGVFEHPCLLIHCLDELIAEAKQLLVDDGAEATAPQRLVHKFDL